TKTCALNIAKYDGIWKPLYNANPTVSLTTPANGATYQGPVSIALNATADDDCAVTKVEFYQGTTLLHTVPNYPWSYTWPNVCPGSYALKARVYDTDGVFIDSAV